MPWLTVDARDEAFLVTATTFGLQAQLLLLRPILETDPGWNEDAS